MKHIFQKGQSSNAPTLLLLHGTGGTEHDLLSIGRMISNDSSLLSVRGNVMEHGMARYFRRIAEGVFDEEDLIFRTKELNQFLYESAEQYQFDRKNIIAIGYSNGANIAASLLFYFKDALKGAILFHPMVPRRGIQLPDLSMTPVFIGAGKNDPICLPKETEELAHLLQEANADVHVHWENNGHQLSGSEITQASTWFQEQFPNIK
jgi:phospholipase/carboxylesterase